MDNGFRMIGDVVGHLTSILIGVLGLGIVAALVFWRCWFRSLT